MPDPAPPPPPPSPADESYYYLMQAIGAALAVAGVAVTVLGLHGMTVHGQRGSVLHCTMSKKWYLYVLSWAVGQLLQLSAVNFGDEPVVAAFTNTAVIFNAWLAHAMLGERITRVDGVAIAAMVAGACLVVLMCPAGQDNLSLIELGSLFTRSPLPIIGIAVTGAIALLAVPSATLSFLHEAHRGPSGGVAWGLLAGYSGAASMTSAKLCFVLFAHYSFDILTLLPAWGIGFVSFVGEIGMVVFIFHGMQLHEASVCVPTYYISMTLFASAQGLCIFQLGSDSSPGLSGTEAAGFAGGVALCTLAVGVMAAVRSRQRGGGARLDRSTLNSGLLEAQEGAWVRESGPRASRSVGARAGPGGVVFTSAEATVSPLSAPLSMPPRQHQAAEPGAPPSSHV